MGLFSFSSRGSDEPRKKRRSSVEVAQEARAMEQARSARSVIEAAYTEAAKKNGRSGMATAGVKLAEAYTKSGDMESASKELTRALGKAWGKKLRTATSALVTRPGRKRKNPEGTEIADLSRPPVVRS